MPTNYLLTHVNFQTQTEDEIEEDIKLYDDDSEELVQFMHRSEPVMIKELQRNIRSHAFDGKWTVP